MPIYLPFLAKLTREAYAKRIKGEKRCAVIECGNVDPNFRLTVGLRKIDDR